MSRFTGRCDGGWFYGRQAVAWRGDFAVFEIDGRFYVVLVGDYQVFSVGPDSPKRGGRWMANGLSDEAIQYVACPRTRKSAMALLRRLAPRERGADVHHFSEARS